MKKFSEFAKKSPIMKGDKIKISEVIGKEISIMGFTLSDSKYDGKDLLTLQIRHNDEDRVVFTGSTVLASQSKDYEDKMPFITTIKKIDDRFYSFT